VTHICYNGTCRAASIIAEGRDLSLAYEPGQIMRKQDICEQLDISRSPVSEAVTRLAAEGLVDVIPQAGTLLLDFRWLKFEKEHSYAKRWKSPP